MSRRRYVNLGGGPIGKATYNDFTHLICKDDEFLKLWHIIGPTIEKQINKIPLWRLFCVAYLQGLENGYKIGGEK